MEIMHTDVRMYRVNTPFSFFFFFFFFVSKGHMNKEVNPTMIHVC